MGYRALYRVWRPQRFDELIGQSVITTTLKNAVDTKQISHAYLFAGPRGTGKTSAAKILAKAVNCPHQKHGEPCNHCRICRAITKGELDDVIEIDAASNNGVDEIRNVRDKARYAPTQAKYKVYIIDEVHMLSTGAFNALLKTLEEPPANVIFIMATTEPQKIPATIISRTQRFNFRRIRPQDILERMEYILKQEKIKYDVKALKVIAKAAEGGMRDALSILDEVLSYGRDQVTYSNALQVTGSVTNRFLDSYLKEVAQHQVKAALINVQKILAAGKDANQFVEALIDYCQNLLLYQQNPQMVLKAELGIIDDHFKVLAQSVSANWLSLIIRQVSKIEEQMRFTVHPDVYLEVLTVRIATMTDQSSQEAKQIAVLTNQVHHLADEMKSLKQLQTRPTETRKSHHVNKVKNQTKVVHHDSLIPTSTTQRDMVNRPQINRILLHATRQNLEKIRAAWNQVIKSLPVTERAVMNVSKPVAASDKGIVIAFAYRFFCQRANHNQTLIKTLKMKLNQIIGSLLTIVFIPNAEWPQIRYTYIRSYSKSNGNNNERQSLRQQVKQQAERIFGKKIDRFITIKEN